MLCLKLQRIGKKKQAFFRLIIQEKARDPHDKNTEILGWYNPYTKTKELKRERISYWLSQGAETTPTVHNLLVDEALISDKKEKTFRVSKKRKEKIAEKNKTTAANTAVKEAAEVSTAPVIEKEEKKEESVPTEVAPVAAEVPAELAQEATVSAEEKPTA
ncbi:MAG TPA: 30S ribosomal protein S16 [bacterium]|nr:30S ribosomal protein S16 [bacterium]HPL95420.1 30S ribosomal protein S16 [bacterium]